MSVLALQGSPRIPGNTSLLLDAVLSEIPPALVIRYEASLLDIRPCVSCNTCLAAKECIIGDDMNNLYPLLATASVVIVATPLYFYGTPAQLKAVIDRCQVFWNNAALRLSDRIGVLLLTAGAPDKVRKGVSTISTAMGVFFDCIGAPLKYTVAATNTDQMPVELQPTLLQQASFVGKQLASGICKHY